MILWLNPISGVSGDMLLGALLGLGADLGAVRAAVASTGVEGWELEVTTADRAGLVATRAVVAVPEHPPARPAARLREIVARARPAPVGALAARAVGLIAEVEAELHGVAVEDVHLHEIGGVDTVVDTVGVAAALHLLGVTDVHCGPIALGTGTVQTHHGTLPAPAPAAAALLARAAAPVVPAASAGETVTPTGAALLLAARVRFGPMPPMTVAGVGYGAGARDVPGRPNVVQALLGVATAGSAESLVHTETNVDDVTGELLGHLIGELLGAGAADAWVAPIVMKKGRPAHTVHVLAAPERAAACREVLLRETGSLGARSHRVERVALPRRTVAVELDGHPVRIKVGPWGRKPEHADLAAAAAALGVPLRVVADRVRLLGDDLDLG